MAHAHPPAIAIIDIGIPGLNGWEVAKRLREAFGPRIGLIALTSLQSPDDRARSLRAGFDVHLVKPATGEVLFRAIDTLSAGLSASQQELERTSPPCLRVQAARSPPDARGGRRNRTRASKASRTGTARSAPAPWRRSRRSRSPPRGIGPRGDQHPEQPDGEEPLGKRHVEHDGAEEEIGLASVQQEAAARARGPEAEPPRRSPARPRSSDIACGEPGRTWRGRGSPLSP